MRKVFFICLLVLCTISIQAEHLNKNTMLYLNMNSKAILGNIQLNNITSFTITQTVQELSSTAKLVVPKAYGKIGQKAILDLLKVGDPVKINLGYDGVYNQEFEGFISEIEADAPLVINCDDKMWPYKQNNWVKSYAKAELKQVLQELFSKLIIDCPQVNLGKFEIDNASSYKVLQDLQSDHGLYSRITGNTLKVGLAYDFADLSKVHSYDIRKDVKANELKYKRKEDMQVRFKAVANLPNGKKKTVIVGSKLPNASEKTLNFAGNFTEVELKEKANAVLAKAVFDGYTGTVTGFGNPLTRSGDCLKLIDQQNPEREGTYMVETVEISYDDNGFSRKNTLSYKVY
jgi:putative transposon-encoded protein